MGRFTASEPFMLDDGRVMMRVPRPKLRLLLESELGQLRAKGIEPTDEEIIWLYELAKERVFPDADRPPSFLVPPVVLGMGTPRELVLHEPTVAWITWLEEYATKWWDERDIRPLVYAYAHSCPGGHALFDDRLGPAKILTRQARSLVNRWFRRLPYSMSLLDWACSQIQTVADAHTECELPVECQKRDADATPMEWGEVVATLSAANGIPPLHYARMNKSLLVDIWNAQDKTPLAQMMSGSGPGERSGGGAMLAMHAAMRHIEQRHSEEAANG